MSDPLHPPLLQPRAVLTFPDGGRGALETFDARAGAVRAVLALAAQFPAVCCSIEL
jgi:hypothetical protein